MANLTIPYNYKPRDYQRGLFNCLNRGYKRAAVIWHRRAGKDKSLWNLIIKEAVKRTGVYYYIFPTYSQGRKILWDGIGKDGFKYIDHVPAPLVKSKHNTEMKIELTTGSIIQIVGSDNIDSIVGTNPVGCVFSEYSLQDPTAWDYIRPILRENGGWAIFNYTPRGHNHGFELYQMAKKNEAWYCELLTVADTNVLSEEDINEEREAGMSEEMVQQEFYCSFEAGTPGAYYSTLLAESDKAGRVGEVPYDPILPVDTWWDLGISDAMSIWFTQTTRTGQIRIVDYYENTGEGLPHYINLLDDKRREHGFVYGYHHGPHDLAVRELGTGKSRIETAQSLGLNFRIVPKLSVQDGIEAARRILPKCWFDETRCIHGLNALRSYHCEYDEKNKVFKKRPKHDWSSHAADAFRYFAVGHKEFRPQFEGGRKRRPRRNQGSSWMAA